MGLRRRLAAALVAAWALPGLVHAQATPISAEADLRDLAPAGVTVNEVNVTGTLVRAAVSAGRSSDVVAFLQAVEGSGLFGSVALEGMDGASEEESDAARIYHLVLRLK